MDSVSGKKFPTLNPATGEKLADIAEGDKVSVIIKSKGTSINNVILEDRQFC